MSRKPTTLRGKIIEKIRLYRNGVSFLSISSSVCDQTDAEEAKVRATLEKMIADNEVVVISADESFGQKYIIKNNRIKE